MSGVAVDRGRRGHRLGVLAAVIAWGLLATGASAAGEAPPPTPAGTPVSPAPTDAPAASRPSATCEPGASFEHQVVGCRAEGLAPGGAVVLRVRLDEAGGAAVSEWVGGVRATDDGTAQTDVAVPCGTAGAATTELSGPLPEGGRFRHRVTLDLDGTCSASPLVPPAAWVGLAALLVGVSVLVVGAGAWRHRTRRRRVSGPGRRGRAHRGRGRRRPPRRRRHRPGRARRRRRRRR